MNVKCGASMSQHETGEDKVKARCCSDGFVHPYRLLRYPQSSSHNSRHQIDSSRACKVGAHHHLRQLARQQTRSSYPGALAMETSSSTNMDAVPKTQTIITQSDALRDLPRQPTMYVPRRPAVIVQPWSNSLDTPS